MSEPAPTPAVPATSETLSAFVTFDRLYYAGKVAINPAHVLIIRANAEDTSIKTRQARIMRTLGFKLVQPRLYPASNWEHWDHPLGARVLTTHAAVTSTREVVTGALSSYLDSVLQPLEARAGNGIVAARIANRARHLALCP